METHAKKKRTPKGKRNSLPVANAAPSILSTLATLKQERLNLLRLSPLNYKKKVELPTAASNTLSESEGRTPGLSGSRKPLKQLLSIQLVEVSEFNPFSPA
jgi:hypothetical protein